MKSIITLVSVSLLLSACHVGRYFYWNFADIQDHKKFPSRVIETGSKPFSFHKPVTYPDFFVKHINFKNEVVTFDEFLQKSKSVAFVVIHNDSVVFEHFTRGYNEKSIVPSFSVAKSFVSTLVGIALEEGKIKRLDEPITNYLKDLDSSKFGAITIEHLLNMRSGIKFNESYYNPFGNVAKAYYGTDLKKLCRKLKIKEKPDENFDYISINTQLLGFIVEEATGKKLDDYLEEKIWKPLGMEHQASWSIDSKKNQNVKAFAALNATVYDFAKLGRLFLNQGVWNGKQIVSKEWVNESLTNGAVKNGRQYSFQWWIFDKYDAYQGQQIGPRQQLIEFTQDGKIQEAVVTPNFGYAAQGILGQFIYFCPQKNVLIVRLGSYSPTVRWSNLFNQIANRF